VKHNTWALSAIRDLQELTNECGLTSVSEALDVVYTVAVAELNETARCSQSTEDTPTSLTANNVVRLHRRVSRNSAL